MNAEGIPFAGQLQEKEYRALMRAARPAFLRLLPWLLLASLGVVMAMGGARAVLASPAEQLPSAVISLFLVGALFAAPELVARSSWKRNSLARERISGAVTSDGLRWEGPSSKAEFPWNALGGYRERKGLLLVYTRSKQAFWLLPRFFATQEAWDRARERIVGNLPRK